jgi:hypothetical protein
MKRTIKFLLTGMLVLVVTLPAQMGLAQESRPYRILFLHHSTGHNLIEEGGVREGLSDLGYEFYDHGYNGDGLRLADGTWTGENFDVPGDNTDPDGLAEIFSQPLHSPPDNTFSHLMQYDVIAFKSCFPASNISDDAQLAAYQSYYLTIRDRADQYPEKLFVVFTPPPQVPNNTHPQEAQRARAFADWLASDEYLSGHPNLVTFNFFALLAGDDHTLRSEYRVDAWDAHPNNLANQTVGPILVAFLDQAIQVYFGGEAPPVVEDPAAAEPEPVGEVPGEGVPSPSQDGRQNLEEALWNPDTDGQVSSITCELDQDLTIFGDSSLHVNYALGADGYASCGNQFEGHMDWSGTDGVGFYFQSDRAGQEITLMIFSGGLDDPIPFEVSFTSPETSVGEWVLFGFAWDEFAKADWYGEGGIAAVDPARIISFAFGLDSATPVQGNFWVDGFSTYVGEPPREFIPEEGQGEVPPSAEGEAESRNADDAGGQGRTCPFSMIFLPMLAVLAAMGAQQRKQSNHL